MENLDRLFVPLTVNDLLRLKELSLKEHENYFKRNSHLKDAFYDSLIGICLCQGAASHFLNTKVGIKDFDIWHFYVENKNIKFPYRGLKTINDGYLGKPIDFLKRAISIDIFSSYPNDSKRIIMNYLLKRDTNTKRLLLKKAILGLSPNDIFGEVFWSGEL